MTLKKIWEPSRFTSNVTSLSCRVCISESRDPSYTHTHKHKYTHKLRPHLRIRTISPPVSQAPEESRWTDAHTHACRKKINGLALIEQHIPPPTLLLPYTGTRLHHACPPRLNPLLVTATERLPCPSTLRRYWFPHINAAFMKGPRQRREEEGVWGARGEKQEGAVGDKRRLGGETGEWEEEEE